MSCTRHIVFLALLSIFLAPAHAEPDPAAILAEQTERRRQQDLERLAREQHSDRFQFERRLDRFDRRATQDGSRAIERKRLRRRLTQIQQRETRSLNRQEQALNHLELEIPPNDFRQRQELARLRHRQRADAFLNRQKLRLRRSGIGARGR